MKEVIAIIRPEKREATASAAASLGAHEVARARVLGRGRQRGLRYLRRMVAEKGGPIKEEAGGMQFLPKRVITWLVPNESVKPLVAAIIDVNQTDNFGDGKIFICPVEDAIDLDTRVRRAQAVSA